MSTRPVPEVLDPIARRIHSARVASGLSCDEVASKLEVSRQTIWAWETGRNSPRITDAKPLCDALGVRPEWLVFGRGKREK
jgi:DNA-binding XRE family transcriptional regulator